MLLRPSSLELPQSTLPTWTAVVGSAKRPAPAGVKKEPSVATPAMRAVIARGSLPWRRRWEVAVEVPSSGPVLRGVLRLASAPSSH